MSIEEARKAALLEAEARALGIQPWMLEMMRAVPTSVVQDIVADSRAAASGGLKPLSEVVEQKPRGTGWVEPRPLEPPPGQQYIDRIADYFAALEAAELARKVKP